MKRLIYLACVSVICATQITKPAFALPNTQELQQIGLIDITTYGADKTGVRDSSDEIQTAINDVYKKNVVLFFPPGIYKISKTLRALADRTGTVGTAFHLIGSTAGNQLPTIVLSSNSFNDNNANNNSIFDNNKKAMLHMWACDYSLKVDNGKTPCDPPYNDQYNTGVNSTNGNTAMLLGHSIQNLRFVIESNNPDAIGLRVTGNQRNVLSNVIVEANDAFAGIFGSVGINSVNQDITVIGGKYGIYNGYGGWATYTNVTLHNQEVLAFTSPNNLPVSLNGFEIVKNTPPAVGQVDGVAYSGDNALHFGAFTLNDGLINFHSDGNSAAIHNPSGKQIAAVNVFINKASKLIQTDSVVFPGNGNGWSKINTYAKTMAEVGFKLVEGNSTREDFNPSNAFTLNNVVPPQPSQLKLKHGLTKERLPSPDVLLELSKNPNSGVINVADHGVTPISFTANPKDTNLPEHSTKLNELMSNPNNKYILLPKGRYFLKNTITLGKDTHLVGIAHQFSEIRTHIQWQPNSLTDVLTTINDSDATTTIAALSVVVEASKTNNKFNSIHWRAGTNSVIYQAFADTYGALGSPRCNEPDEVANRYGNERYDYYFSDNAGGRVWGTATGGAGCSKYHPKYRGILVKGTSQPLTIYGYNPEDGHGDILDKEEGFQGEIVNSQNVSIIGHKSEESYSLLVRNSNNIFILNPSGSVGWSLRDNNNILILNTVAKFIRFGKSQNSEGKIVKMIEEKVNGQLTQSYNSSQTVSAIKRGNVDFSVWDPNYQPPIDDDPTPTSEANNPTATPTDSDRNFDFNNDSKFDWLDILLFLPRFGQENRPKYDLNSNGIVDIFDFATTLLVFNK